MWTGTRVIFTLTTPLLNGTGVLAAGGHVDFNPNVMIMIGNFVLNTTRAVVSTPT